MTHFSIFDMLEGALSALPNFPKQYPLITGWFTVIVSGGVVFKALWSFWKRPIIRVRLKVRYGSLAPVNNSKYLRLSVANGGLTTLKGCSASMIDATVWRKAADKEFFNLDPRTYGWSNDATSKKRDLPYKAAHTLDIARLVMPEGGGSSVLFWNPDEMPATLYQFPQPDTPSAYESMPKTKTRARE
jgi:hypothetical protein